MRALLSAFLVLLVLPVAGALAKDIRKGAIVQVKADAIWFEGAAQLTHWQKLKKSGKPAALASYEDEVRARREAWQFSVRQTVKILAHEPAAHQIHVEMLTEGRMHGTRWLLDASALAP
jgi:hypothetical protein